MDALSTSPPSRCVFCAHCGAIMDEPTFVGSNVDCRVCGTTVGANVFRELVLHSAGAEHLVESEADQAASKQQTQKARATVKEPCPKCNHPELQYYTMQLRSADEGQTVFYECSKCGHAFSTNT